MVCDVCAHAHIRTDKSALHMIFITKSVDFCDQFVIEFLSSIIHFGFFVCKHERKSFVIQYTLHVLLVCVCLWC